MADRSTAVALAIQQYLHRNELTQKWLAAAVKTNEVAISQRLTGKRKLTLDAYLRICDALEVGYAEFLPEQPAKVKGRIENGGQQ